MYTATIQSKVIEQGVLTVHVEFTNGVVAVVESCKPQNEDGLRYWVKSRLETFNAGEEIASMYADGSTVDVLGGVVTPPTPTAQEIARDAWLKDYRKYTKVKTTLVDTGVLTGNEAWFVTLRNKVTNDLSPAYLDFI